MAGRCRPDTRDSTAAKSPHAPSRRTGSPGRGSDRSRSGLSVIREQAHLLDVRRRGSEPEMTERLRGEQAAARRPLDEALLEKERFDDLLDRVARLRQRRGDGLDADRAAAETLRDQLEIAPVERIEAERIDL